MLSAKNLKKTYFKGRSNEIKVINDTTLLLPDTGLISFLGQSGSGKTTLLNTLGGLDKANSGSISYDDITFDSYKMDKIDKYRRNNIGYVFQNYLLIEEMSVYDNLKLALDIIDIHDEDEVKKRIEYALRAVGLYKYRKKLASALSGGQQQRVSIARALVKKCKVIIADEPTGNLDSENSIEIMNILKKISKESLVLLVTHSPELASFYSDRIINIKDGVIESDSENTSSGELNRQNDKTIHLLDYDKKVLSSDKVNLTIYTNDSSKEQNITVVIKNNMIYIDSETPLQVVSSSEVKLVEDHYKKLDIHSDEVFSYDTSWYKEDKKKRGFKNFLIDLAKSFKKVFFGSRKSKVFNTIFIVLGIIMGILVISENVSTKEKYNNGLNNYYTIYQGDKPYLGNVRVNMREVKDAINEGIISDLASDGKLVDFNFRINSVIESKIMETGILSFDYSKIQDEKLVAGKEPERITEVVVGKLLADKLISADRHLKNYDMIVGGTFETYTIVGVSSSNTYAIYYKNYCHYIGSRAFMDSREFTYLPYTDEKVSLVEGKMPTGKLEIAVSKSVLESRFLILGKTIPSPYGDVTLVGVCSGGTVGAYTSDVDLLSTRFMYNANSGKYELEKANNPLFYEDLVSSYSLMVPNTMVEYQIVDGNDITGKNQLLVTADYNFKVGDVLRSSGSASYTVVGIIVPKKQYVYVNLDSSNVTFIQEDSSQVLYASNDTILDSFFLYVSNTNDIYRIDNYEKGKEYFEKKGYSILESNEYVLQTTGYYGSDTSLKLIFEIVLLVIIIVYTFFSERARIISDVYGIGVMRSLGVPRKNIYRTRFRDNFAKTTLTSILGYIVVVTIYVIIANQINSLGEGNYLSLKWLYIFGGGIILYVVELLISMIPLFFLLKKTPSEIISKYDI